MNFDEQMRQNEAAGDNLDLDVDEEGNLLFSCRKFRHFNLIQFSEIDL